MLQRSPIQHTTERLSIREFKTSDAEFVLELVNTPGWLEFIGNRGVTTLEEAQIYLVTGPMNHYQQYGYGLYRVALQEGDVPIGMCGLINRDGLQNADLGFAFLPEYVGKGYASEAARLIINQATTELGFSIVDAITLPKNKNAIQLLQKLNFTYLQNIQFHGDAEILSLYRWSECQ